MKRGAVPSPIPIGQPEALIAADLERLKEKRYVASTPQKLRDSHHMIARLAATGLRHHEIAERTGYSRVRVNDLLASPAMDIGFLNRSGPRLLHWNDFRNKPNKATRYW